MASSADGAHLAVAREICESFLSWISAALAVNTEAERANLAALALATLEGFVLLDALKFDSGIQSALAGLALRGDLG